MSIFETFRQGILGLFLFAGNWVLPSDDASLHVEKVSIMPSKRHEISLTIQMTLDKRLIELIDAGIPLNFKFTATSDNNDTLILYRSLHYNVASICYTIHDSIPAKTQMSNNKRTYPMILLAMRDYSTWKFQISPEATICRTEATILNSRVSQLNRFVDMSKIWGHQRLETNIDLRKVKR